MRIVLIKSLAAPLRLIRQGNLLLLGCLELVLDLLLVPDLDRLLTLLAEIQLGARVLDVALVVLRLRLAQQGQLVIVHVGLVNQVAAEQVLVLFAIKRLVLQLFLDLIFCLVGKLLLVQLLVEVFLVEIIDVFVEGSHLQPVEELLFDGTVDLRRLLSLGLSVQLSLLVFSVDGHDDFLVVGLAQPQASLSDDHLVQLRQTLLALVPLELAPELNLLVDHL